MELDAHLLRPVIASLITDELADMRGVGRLDLSSGSWNGATVIGSDELPVDSIEMVSLATSCAELFGLQETGAGDYLLRYRSIAEWAELAVDGIRDTGMVSFRTSGTTGNAKTVSHRLVDLEQEVVELTHLVLGVRRMVSLVPAHHIYGFLFTVLLPMHLGLPVNRDGCLSGLPPRHLESGDWLIGFPLRWRQIKRLRREIPSGVSAVTSTSPCPSELVQDMKSLGLDRMLAIYGATETAGVGYRFDAEQPYTLFDYWSWSGSRLHRCCKDGRLIEIEPEDELAFENDGQFRPMGRKDTVVQVAGRNVRPEHVAARITAHPLVERCSVELDTTRDEPRLTASIILVSNASATDAESVLHRWAQEKLNSAERPMRWTFAGELPATATGKTRGWSLSS
ncbi:AMP-binding protein [Wenzhouxiangella sp. AB-CW3]|uniref:AMP-binding protein n=1 Tax=Wenzhouxiangella sp. AB-CW3 TaxID=2771012 RepID=UPI00168AA5CE|nr:AMP-binding protein [Wenzhouxiangella sp. AB-CW3]QOC22888.1 AMP-binding protein [Wenzhouxiangella sp. AB-CW3]